MKHETVMDMTVAMPNLRVLGVCIVYTGALIIMIGFWDISGGLWVRGLG